MNEELIKFLSQELKIRETRISSLSSLASDLGVAGDDGAELIAKFGKQFSVDTSRVNYIEYFGDEDCNPLALFVPAPRRTLKPLTVADLEKAIELKILV